ncbi:MAG: DNA alkylation repair protein [Candidatus Kapabacteria bacterium]|nr:DNA alkylation repair protein [Candidatus Kapabacteria bacterium]
MTLNDIMMTLVAAGSEQTRKTYARHGIKGAMFGVSYAVLEKLRKKIKCAQSLALELWETDNHDARILATMIADPAKCTAVVIEDWAKDLDNYALTDALGNLAAQTPEAHKLMTRWMQSEEEWLGTLGWVILSVEARNSALPDSFFAPYLSIIEREIHLQKNRVRYSMNGALISIGGRGGSLEEQALASAARIGKVRVDHGDTNCKTPDAATYIKKITARREAIAV